MSKTEWTINSEARPEAVGWYWVTLDYPGQAQAARAGGSGRATRALRPTYRVVERLYFAQPGSYKGYPTMGEDRNNYHWADQTTYARHERVIAWIGPIEPPEVFRGELADGYEYVWE